MILIDVQAVCAFRQNLWPKAKWPKEQMEVFSERLATINTTALQATVAMRELVATRSGWPSVNVVLEAIRGTLGQRAVTDKVATRADHMRKLLAVNGIHVDNTDSAVFQAYWLDECHRAMLMRGDIPQSHRNAFDDDAGAMGLGGREAEEIWDWIISQTQIVEIDPDLSARYTMLRTQVEKMVFADEKSPRGDKHSLMASVRPPSARAQKRAWLANRVRLHDAVECAS